MSTCLKNHPRCGRSSSRGLYAYHPTRLLDLQPNQPNVQLRLRTTHKDPPETAYMTVSHCWGTVEVLKLSRSNFEYLEAGFKLTELPRSFREAIQITRELGIRYLWIDALCIVQDSPEDWRCEAGLMGKVYENSYCNIAILDAFDSEQGCFSHRDPLLVPRITVQTDWNNALNGSYDLYPQDFWESHVDRSPLSRRAWVVQERILAPRTLYYGEKQILWECLELDACETYPEGVPKIYSRKWKRVDLDPQNFRKNLAQKPELRQVMYAYWHTIVGIYSRCSLTRAKDKLVAISGLAKRVQSCLSDAYLAGLWKESLPSELL